MSTGALLVGGGLANTLIALRLVAQRPDVPVTLLESGPALGGNHTWSFHGSDVTPAIREWLVPLADHHWPHYDVRFPERSRRLTGDYYSLSSASLHVKAMRVLGERVRLHSRVARVAPTQTAFDDGGVLEAELVIDGRGFRGEGPGLSLRYQKFVGQRLRLTEPHGLEGPVLMDACVAQDDGYRFIYLLPFAADEVLVEDTRYSDSAALDPAALQQNIGSYVAARGWTVRSVVGEEAGVLPIALDADIDAFWPAVERGMPRSGMRAGLFHHTTGYSLPEAARLADALAAQPVLTSAIIGPWIHERAAQRWRDQRVFRLLNRMLFLGAAPSERWQILQHFYRLPEPLIERFYAGRLGPLDALRILSGKPPIPVHRALRHLLPAPERG